MYNVHGWLLNDPEYNKYVEVIRRNFLIIHMFIAYRLSVLTQLLTASDIIMYMYCTYMYGYIIANWWFCVGGYRYERTWKVIIVLKQRVK